MLTPEQIKQGLSESNLRAVSEAAGINYMTLYRFIKSGARPSYETVKKLSDYLESKL